MTIKQGLKLHLIANKYVKDTAVRVKAKGYAIGVGSLDLGRSILQYAKDTAVRVKAKGYAIGVGSLDLGYSILQYIKNFVVGRVDGALVLVMNLFFLLVGLSYLLFAFMAAGAWSAASIVVVLIASF